MRRTSWSSGPKMKVQKKEKEKKDTLKLEISFPSELHQFHGKQSTVFSGSPVG